MHYPRTPHLPWSPGAGADDVRAGDLSGLVGREVVVTEKLDGENTTMYADGLHARSLDSAHHPSRAWVKALHGRIARTIPDGWRVCGENLYARHSIAYHQLESWFYAFSVWTGEHCLDWDRTVRFARRLGVPTPPVLWRGNFDERALRKLRLDRTRQEGYVVRTVDGFHRDEFAQRVAKWVRPGHVQTDEHWMLAPVVENGLGVAAPLWAVRSGADPGLSSLLAAVGVGTSELSAADVPEPVAVARAEAGLVDVRTRLDLLGRCGDTRLAGVLAALFHGCHRSWLAPRLVAPLGMPLARRIADLVGLHTRLHRPFPDNARRAGLVRWTAVADLGVLHAVAAASLAARAVVDGSAHADRRAVVDGSAHADSQDAADAREQVDWSALYAEKAGLLGETPLASLRTGLRQALRGCAADAADRCWAEAREAYALGRVTTADSAVAATWRWRDGDFPRLVLMVGPSGSGKSSLARRLPGVDDVVSLDDLRAAHGSRADQRANAAILHHGLRQLDDLLTDRRTVVWDATALNRQQRSLVHAVARRRNASTTHAVLLVPEDVLIRRNAERLHQVPSAVLAAQLRRFCPPYPGEAHHTWYVDATGAVRDVAGTLAGEED
ncbi:RNA ligase family protein [Micromonospora polyrhachis]|uniref:Putative kinase n=1 Tax=Micromonospora polyrhachis TaxID=1282883 RepID=A0A7W7SW90_9ACTN|nr:RNA ligase family protein [Micromonospora polyrhachis]MBB4961512.1 putative kinase [Micromonospora polyrhachis]